MAFLLHVALGLSPAGGQDARDALSSGESRELQALLEETLKAKPGTTPLDLTNATTRRQFDLAGRAEQYGLLRLNKSMVEKRYEHDGEFVAYYMSRFGKLFDEKTRNAWLLAYAAGNKTEKAFFVKVLGGTGLPGQKRETVILGYYHLPLTAERVFYAELVSLVYKDGRADFSALPKRAKDWIAAHNDLFP
jgi:hypothetical protein